MITFVRQDNPRLRERLDPAFWDPRFARVLDGCPHPTAPLGDFIEHLTYGPIITGRQPPHDPDGVVIVHQGQVRHTGVDPTEALRVPAGCEWDLPRCRLRPGDVILPRSGEGSLARNRVAVFAGDQAATVGSFVDLIRLREIEPAYVVLFLKTPDGWLQILRLINGVGQPNISFDEIRSLRVPVIPEKDQALVRSAWAELQRQHDRVVAWKQEALAAGEVPRALRGSAELRRLEDEADDALAWAVATVAALVWHVGEAR
jgi:hypothetical protein